MKVSIAGLTARIEGITIVDGVALHAGSGEVVGLVGPNGSGKSTLLRCVYRVLRPAAGQVHLDDQEVWALGARQVAQRLAVVTQEHPGDFGFTVEEVVLMGRSPHKGLLERDSLRDVHIVEQALRWVGLEGFGRRAFSALSGGEKQRVLLARALAQQPRALILDEPTNHLDIQHQLDLLELVRDLGVTAVMAVHDLNLAASYCSRVYVLHAGRIVAGGPPAEVLQPDLIRAVFRVEPQGWVNPATGAVQFAFAPLASTRAAGGAGTMQRRGEVHQTGPK